MIGSVLDLEKIEDQIEFLTGIFGFLRYLIGVASVARACSSYFDSLTQYSISTSITNGVGRLGSDALSSHPDFMAFGLCLAVALLIAANTR